MPSTIIPPERVELLKAAQAVIAQSEKLFEVDDAGSHHLTGYRVPIQSMHDLVAAALEARLAS